MKMDKEGERIPLQEFKRRVAEVLDAPKLALQDISKDIGEVASIPNSEERFQPSQTCYELSNNVLFENKENKLVHFYLCKLVQN